MPADVSGLVSSNVTAITARVGLTWRYLQLDPLYHREEGSVEMSRSMCVVMPVRARSVVSVLVQEWYKCVCVVG
jgi:hypothetical protein